MIIYLKTPLRKYSTVRNDAHWMFLIQNAQPLIESQPIRNNFKFDQCKKENI